MKSLIRLVESLEPQEVRFIQDYHAASRSKQRSDLFNRLVNGKIKSNNDALEQLYNKKENAASALSHLKKKLREEILNLMLVMAPDSNKLGKDNKEILCEKYLLQSEVLFSKGLNDEGSLMLEKTIRLANKYDLPQINLSSYYLMLENKQLNDFGKINENFEVTIARYRELVEAKSAYYSGNQIRGDDKTGGGVGFHPCKRTIYWRRLTEMENLCNGSDFEAALESAQELLDYLLSEKILYSRQKEAHLYRMLFVISMHQHEYVRAMEYASESCELLDFDCQEYMVSRDYLFLAYLRNGLYDEAEKIYRLVEKRSKTDNCLSNKWSLNYAALKFYQGKFDEVKIHLNLWKNNNSKEAIWDLAPRFLELLTILELKDFDWYTYRLECLRKKISNGRLCIPERARMVYNLFHSVIKTHFCFDKLVQLEKNSILKLTSQDPEYRWDPTGFELINIPEWLIHKQREFNFTYL